MNLKELSTALKESLKKGLQPIRDAVTSLSGAMVELDDRLKSVEAKQPLTGPQGERGEPGPAGEKGEAGPMGEKGAPGERGDRGERGEVGAKGDPGDAGPPGERGTPGERGEQGAKGDPGQPGERGEAGAKGDPGERGEKGDPGDRGERGESGPAGEKGDVGPSGERGEKGDKGDRGDPGEKGEPGRDAEQIEIADVVKELIKAPELGPILALLVAEAVAKHFTENPVKNGADGAPGARGEKGDRGEPGEKGCDGCGVSDLLIDRAGALVATMTDGRMKKLGVVVGRDGVDGKDGAGVESVTLSYDSEAHEVVERWSAGGVTKELRRPAGGIHHRGYWRDGTQAKSGEAWTQDGSLWIAKRDTATKPCYENGDDWQLAAKKGRDYKADVRTNEPKSAPVKLSGGRDA